MWWCDCVKMVMVMTDIRPRIKYPAFEMPTSTVVNELSLMPSRPSTRARFPKVLPIEFSSSELHFEGPLSLRREVAQRQ